MKKLDKKTKMILAGILLLALVFSCVFALKNQVSKSAPDGTAARSMEKPAKPEGNRTLSHEACWTIFGIGALIIVVTLIRASADKRKYKKELAEKASAHDRNA